MHQLEGFGSYARRFRRPAPEGCRQFIVQDISGRPLGIAKLSSFGLHFIVELPTIVFLVNPRIWKPFRVRLAMLYQLILYFSLATVT